MFGLGFPEILFIVLVATLVLGPEHMPRAARMLGRWSAKTRSAATSLTQAITDDASVHDLQGNLGAIREELQRVQTELVQVKDEVTAPIEKTEDVFSANVSHASVAPVEDVPDKNTPCRSASDERLARDRTDRTGGHHRVALPHVALLPGPVSRLVTRSRVSLPPAVPSDDGETRGVLIDLPHTGKAFERPRILPVAQPATATLRHIPLGIEQNV